MLLENKVAVIYGGNGSIGSAVAKAFAREGARVFLAGLTREKLDYKAGRSARGRAAFVPHDGYEVGFDFRDHHRGPVW